MLVRLAQCAHGGDAFSPTDACPVDLLSTGTHCAVMECRQLDFLPATCTKCAAVTCAAHASCAAHRCPNKDINDVNARREWWCSPLDISTYYYWVQRRVPECPVCHKLVSFPKTGTINDQVRKNASPAATLADIHRPIRFF